MEAAGIEIENLPVRTTKEDLVRIFHRELLNDNEVQYILHPLLGNRTKAFICFKHYPDKTLVDRLTAFNQSWNVRLDSRLQTYNSCCAEVDALIVAAIPNISDCIAMLKIEYGIAAEYNDDSGSFTLKGSLMQLECAREKLNAIFEEQKILQKFELQHISQSFSQKTLGSSDMEPTIALTSARRDHFSELAKQDKPNYSSNDYGELGQNKNIPFEGNFGPRSVIGSSSPYEPDDNEISDNVRYRRTQYEKPSVSLLSRSSKSPSLHSSHGHFSSGPFSAPISLPSFLPSSLSHPELYSEDTTAIFQHKRSDDVDFRSQGPNRSRQLSANESDHTYCREDKIISTVRKENRTDLSTDHFYDIEAGKLTLRGLEPINLFGVVGEPKPLTNPTGDFGALLNRERPERIGSSLNAHDASAAASALIEQRMSEPESGKESQNKIALWKKKLDTIGGKISTQSHESSTLVSRTAASAGHSNVEMTAPGENPSSNVLPPVQSRFFQDRLNLNEQGFKEEGLPTPDTVSSTTVDDQASLFLEAYVVKYIVAIEKEYVDAIKKKHKVEMEVRVEPGSDIATVVFSGFDGHPADQVRKASEKFVKFYEAIFSDIIQRRIEVNTNLPEVADVIQSARNLYGERVILITDVPQFIIVVGGFQEVMQVMDMLTHKCMRRGEFLQREKDFTTAKPSTDSDSELDVTLLGKLEQKKYLSSSTDSSSTDAARLKSHHSTRESKSSSVRSFQSSGDDLCHGIDSVSTSGAYRSLPLTPAIDSCFQIRFRDDFQVFIYCDDITKLKVNAIVSAANSCLKNYAGVAGAIEDAGGPQFRKECENFVLLNGSLKVTEVAHTPAYGDLRCDNVIHAVGPQWYLESNRDRCASLLQKTFGNILIYADQVLKATSLAVPAVGTGVFEVPLDLCARAMYWALCEFVERFSSRSSLKYVHLVNRDPGTTEMIQVVFEGLEQQEPRKPIPSVHRASSSKDAGSRSEIASACDFTSNGDRALEETSLPSGIRREELVKPAQTQQLRETILINRLMNRNPEVYDVPRRSSTRPENSEKVAEETRELYFRPISDSESDTDEC